MDFGKINFITKTLSKKEIFLVVNKTDILYLTHKEFDGVSLVISSFGEVYCLVSPMLVTQAKKVFKKEVNEKNFVVGDNLVSQLKSLPIKFKKIFVEKNVSLTLYNLLTKHWSLKTTQLITNLRQTKSKQEIKNVLQAVDITKKVLLETKKILKVGVTEKEVKKYILKKFLDYDVEPSFEPIVAFNENTSFPHHISEEKRFNKKSFVLIDLGCKVNGYCSDVTRMFFVEKNDVVWYYYRKLCELQNKLVSMCVVGKKVSEIDSFAKKFCKNIGVEKNYLHSTGHGVGLEIHELPRINVEDESVLKEGMVITIEPGIYFGSRFGLRKEDMVLVTKTFPKVLTKNIF
jgi:Xaa-Pro aminopeptidase